MTAKCNIRNFGYHKSQDEAFCTGLLVQSLSLSSEFSSLFLKIIGYGTRYRITSIECEKTIPNSQSRPDVWIDVAKKNDDGGLPIQVLLESKILSAETKKQLTDYQKYVNSVNRGEVYTHRKAKLILLSADKNMKVSCEPDLRISWNEVLDIISDGGWVGKNNFKGKYFSMVHEHLSFVCRVAPPKGITLDFIQMMEQLAKNRSWLEYRPTNKQVACIVIEDSWIQSKKTGETRDQALIRIDKVPPKLNSITEKWLMEWLSENEDNENLIGDARRNGLNHARLYQSLEEILGSA